MVSLSCAEMIYIKVGQIRNGSRFENEGNLRLVMSSDLKDIGLEK